MSQHDIDFPTEYLELKCQGLDTEGSHEGLIDTASAINAATSPDSNVKFNYAFNYFSTSEFEFQEYAKLRLYLGPLSVDITDRTFSSHYWADISGTRHGHTDNLFVTLGNASACQSSWNAAGKGNIDLRGTPFKAPSSSNVFTVHGWNPSGGATFSENDQVIAITGGGHCILSWC